jgi:hypothetical protein
MRPILVTLLLAVARSAELEILRLAAMTVMGFKCTTYE